MCVCMHVCVYVCMHVCMYVSMHVFMFASRVYVKKTLIEIETQNKFKNCRSVRSLWNI